MKAGPGFAGCVFILREDDTQKPDIGVQKTQKLIESDHVDFIVGYIWSNVILASLKPLVDSKTMTVMTNAGASQLAGELCSPYVFSTSWQNDQTPEAMGLYMNQKGVKSAFLIGPNYAAGRDMLAGLKLTYKGKIVGEEYTRWPDQLDFSAELSKARASGAESIFVFYPGGAGMQFVTQYTQSGLKGQIPLYQVFTIDELSHPAAQGSAHRHSRRAGMGQRPAQRGQQEIRRRLQRQIQELRPSYYGAQTYDACRLIDSAVTAVKGDLSKKEEMRKEMEKADFKSRARQLQIRQQPHARSRTSTCRMWSNRAMITCSRRRRRSSRMIRTASTTNVR